MGFFKDLLGGTAKKEAKKARQLQEQMVARWEGLEVPTSEQLALSLPTYGFDEAQTAEQQQLYEADPTAMEDIVSDPQLRAAQVNTLNQM